MGVAHRNSYRGSIQLAAGVALLLAAASLPAWGQAGAECPPPLLEVRIADVARGPVGAGEAVVLHVDDRNPAGVVSGYNVYRSSDPSLPRGSWGLVAIDAVDEDAATPLVQLAESTGGQTAGELTFWVVTALNGPCSVEGPWHVSNLGDTDGDGIGAADDPCPATPLAAELLTRGCSATDLLLRPEVLTGPIRRGIERFRTENVDVVVPAAVSRGMDLAEGELRTAFGDLRGASPCDGAASLGAAGIRLADALTGIEEHLAGLAGGAAPAAAESPAAAGEGDGTDGPLEWPSDEVLHWQGQHLAVDMLIAEAAAAAATGAAMCAAQGPSDTVEGRVRSISDDGRLVTLTSGERIVMAWTAAGGGAERLATDTDVGLEVNGYDAVRVGTFFDKLSPDFPFLPVPAFDDCLKLRVLPIQPYQPSNWIRHAVDGYQSPSGRLDLEAGMRLLAEGMGCPGVFQGGGPSGEDLRLDYFFELLLTHTPKEGAAVANAPLSQELSSGQLVSFPDIDPTVDATLAVNRMKRTCLDSGLMLPIIDPYSGNVVGTQPLWNCSAEQSVDSQSYVVRMADPQAYCSVAYAATTYAIEDDEPQDWRQSQVTNATPLLGVPGPVAFSAIGDRVLGGQPSHGQAVGVNQAIAIYGRHGHSHTGHGTNRRSGLDWPRITGTRNGQPYRYSCSVPRLVRDRIATCQVAPDTYYRLPFPLAEFTTVNQGNGGSFTHNGWQFFALDLSGVQGEPLRAARGGTVVRLRKNMNKNCMTQTCTDWGFPLLDEYGNHVALQHEDGTVSWYAHMVQSSSPLFLGQAVKRGGYLGDLGNTGNSSGPHLHIHTTPESPSQWGNTTIQVRYELFDLPSLTLKSCVVPQQGVSYASTNEP